MKKVLSFLLVVTLLLSLTSGFVLADVESDPETEFMAAPAVASQLLKEAGIPFRYGGRGKDGGNYIKDVAAHMGPQTDFEYPEGNLVSKTDVAAYKRAVAWFLADQGADLGENYFEAVLVSVVYDGNGDAFGTEADEVLTLTFSNDIAFFDTDQEDSDVRVRFLSGVNRLGESPAHMLYEIDGNVLTITSLVGFSTPRPAIGDYVTAVEGIVDVDGDPVVVPEGGVIVEELVEE